MRVGEAPSGRDLHRVDAAALLEHERKLLDVGREAEPVEHLGDHELERRPRPRPPLVLVRDQRRHALDRLRGRHAADAQHIRPHERGVRGVGTPHEQAVVE